MNKKRRKDPLKWFWIGISIAISPFLTILFNGLLKYSSDQPALAAQLDVYSHVISFITVPLGMIIAIIGGAVAYTKFGKEMEYEIEAREKELESNISISNK